MRQHADRGPLVHGRAREKAVGPVDDELVGVREALGSHELRARVAHRHAVAEIAAERGERRGEVDGAEDVQLGTRSEGGDEDLVLADGHEPRLTAGEQRPSLPAELSVVSRVGVDEVFLPDSLAARLDRERDGPLGFHRLCDRRHELGVQRVDEDVHGAAAGEADLEGLVVGDAVGQQPGRAAREHGLSLLVHRGLDAAAGDGAGDLAPLGDGEHGARVAGRGALGADDGCRRGP